MIPFNEYHLAHPHLVPSIIYRIDSKQSHTLCSGWSDTVASFNALVMCGFWFAPRQATVVKQTSGFCLRAARTHLSVNVKGLKVER